MQIVRRRITHRCNPLHSKNGRPGRRNACSISNSSANPVAPRLRATSGDSDQLRPRTRPAANSPRGASPFAHANTPILIFRIPVTPLLVAQELQPGLLAFSSLRTLRKILLFLFSVHS